jgi:AcrR family transcriptional regulator
MKNCNKQNKDTRALLLKHAEELFLRHGFEGVSIRKITEASGANVAAVNYHFNGKTNLYREVVAQRLEGITLEKLALLKELDEQRPAATIEQILHSYIYSYFDAHFSSPDSDRLLQIIYREMAPDAIAGDLVAERLVIPIQQAFQKIIMKTCPELHGDHISRCISSITGQVLHFIRAREVLKGIRPAEQNQTFIEDTVKHITQFSLRGIGSQNHA